MKRLSLLVVLLVFTVSSLAGANPIVIKFGCTQPADFELSPTYSAIYRFKDYVEASSDGRVQVDLIMGGALGSERENLESVRMNSMQMTLISDGTIPGFFRPMEVMSIPYLFSSETVAWEVLDGRFGQEMAEAMAEQIGVRILAWAENGFRNFTNSKRPIRSPQDMKGLKIRTMENPAHITMVKALGADPTPIPWLELYGALQLGVVDGQENPLSLIYQSKFWEVQEYLTLDGHLYGPHLLLINEEFFKGLPEDIRLMILQAAEIHKVIHRGQQQALQARSSEVLRNAGMKIYRPTPSELMEFRNITQKPVLEYLRTRIDQYWIDLLLNEVKAVEEAQASSAK